MSGIIKNKIIYISDCDILLFSYKELLALFDEIESLIESHYINRDRNAVYNYKKVFESYMTNGCRPQKFDRSYKLE